MKRIVFILLIISGLVLGFKQEKKSLVFSTNEGAIRGYDPVAYFTQGKPVKGEVNITVLYKEATWHFSSTENKKLFEKNPEKYAPQYGGWCAYGWAKGYQAKIEADAWSIVGGKLYLNYDFKVQKMWEEKQTNFIRVADVNYAKKNF